MLRLHRLIHRSDCMLSSTASSSSHSMMMPTTCTYLLHLPLHTCGHALYTLLLPLPLLFFLQAPHETLLVVDGSVGRNAVDQANAWRKYVGVSGLVITKLDGTARG